MHFLKVTILEFFAICFVSMVFGSDYETEPVVSFTLNMTATQSILTCHVRVPKFESNFKIMLECPLTRGICISNCIPNKPKSQFDYKVRCNNRQFNQVTGEYEIDYIINNYEVANNGKWICRYKGSKSTTIYVNNTEKPQPTPNPLDKVVVPIETVTLSPKKSITTVGSKLRLVTLLSNNGDYHYNTILTTSQFILIIIALLALSLICNIIFCMRIVINHMQQNKHRGHNCKYKNDPMQQSNIFTHHPIPRNQSDCDRIYDETSLITVNPPSNHQSHSNGSLQTIRQPSFVTKIQQSNGVYLSPTSGYPTLLHSSLPLNEVYMSHTPLPDHSSTAYGALTTTYPSSNNDQEPHYTNYLPPLPMSPSPQITSSSPSSPQQMYLSFYQNNTTPLSTPKYINTTESPQILTVTPSTDLASTPLTAADNSDMKLITSRIMMEKADNLLRSADTLLKSSTKEFNSYQ